MVLLRRAGLPTGRPAELDVNAGAFGHDGLQRLVDERGDHRTEDALLEDLVLVENLAGSDRITHVCERLPASTRIGSEHNDVAIHAPGEPSTPTVLVEPPGWFGGQRRQNLTPRQPGRLHQLILAHGVIIGQIADIGPEQDLSPRARVVPHLIEHFTSSVEGEESQCRHQRHTLRFIRFGA